MNFDVRSYCERLAKADPARFEICKEVSGFNGKPYWFLKDKTLWPFKPDNGYPCACWPSDNQSQMWAFIGPLADELGVTGDNITAQEKQPDGRYLGHLEATFAAVVEKLEAAKEEAV